MSRSSKWTLFAIGGCGLVTLCGVGVIALLFISSFASSQYVQQPLYSEPQQLNNTAPEQLPSSQGGILPALVGHWRYTSIFGSGDFTVVTDYHLILNSDGTFSSFSKDEDGQQNDYVSGTWTSTEAIFTITASDGSVASSEYTFMMVIYFSIRNTANLGKGWSNGSRHIQSHPTTLAL